MAVIDKSTRDVVELEVYIDARPETIFPFLTVPEKMVRWFGWPETDLDPRPGGIFRTSNKREMTIIGTYVESVPNERVVFTWGWEGSATVPPGSTRVEITLMPERNGTLLRLKHLDLVEQERGQHVQGWQHYLERLQVAAAGGEPGPDPWAA